VIVGKLGVHVGKQRLEARQHEHQHDHHRDAGKKQQDERINQTVDHPRAHLGAAFEVVGKPQHHRIQRPGGLAGAHHIEIQTREGAAFFLECA